MAEPKWAGRERPILEALASVEEREGQVEDVDALVDLTGLERRAVVLGVRTLIDGRYVTAVPLAGDFDLDGDYADVGLLERGRRAVGQWPSEEATGEAFLEALRGFAEGAATPEERTGRTKLLEAATGLSTATLGGVMIAFAKQRLGLDS